jgi:cytoskeletal protein RodZ
MQALQLIMQVLPVLAQLGQIYDIKQISDHVLQTFNIDPSRITMQIQTQQQPTPDTIPTQETPTENPTPTEEEPTPNPAEPTATQTTTQPQPTNIEEILASLLAGGMP